MTDTKAKKFTKMVIAVKPEGARGTADCAALVDTLSEHWDAVRDRFNAMPEDEQEELKDHFNGEMENSGDLLFGEDSTADDLEPYIAALDDEAQTKFVETVNEAMLFQPNAV